MVDRKHRDFAEADIQKLADIFTAFQEGNIEDAKGFCAVVSTEDIAKVRLHLNPGVLVSVLKIKRLRIWRTV